MRKLHGGLVAAATMAMIGGFAAANAQDPTPYKLGMFVSRAANLSAWSFKTRRSLTCRERTSAHLPRSSS